LRRLWNRSTGPQSRPGSTTIRFGLSCWPLAGFLKSQRRLYVDGALTLRRELREARGTIIDRADVERGVLRGVSAHMSSLVRLMTWRTQ
jgi:hypothetical protein